MKPEPARRYASLERRADLACELEARKFYRDRDAGKPVNQKAWDNAWAYHAIANEARKQGI